MVFSRPCCEVKAAIQEFMEQSGLGAGWLRTGGLARTIGPHVDP